jgi:hypothetical protein
MEGAVVLAEDKKYYPTAVEVGPLPSPSSAMPPALLAMLLEAVRRPDLLVWFLAKLLACGVVGDRCVAPLLAGVRARDGDPGDGGGRAAAGGAHSEARAGGQAGGEAEGGAPHPLLHRVSQSQPARPCAFGVPCRHRLCAMEPGAAAQGGRPAGLVAVA